MARWLAKGKHRFSMFVFLFVASLGVVSEGAELPLVRIAYAAFNEKLLAL